MYYRIVNYENGYYQYENLKEANNPLETSNLLNETRVLKNF